MSKKTHKGAAKRFKLTKSGKILARKAFYQRKLIKKRGAQKQKARKPIEITGKNKRQIRRLLNS